MSSIYYTVFMLFLTVSEALRCVDQHEVQLLITTMQMDDIEKSLMNLKSNDNEKCQVYMEFNSASQELIIKFGYSMKFPRLRSIENTYIHRTTSIQLNTTSILTTIEILCYSNNECDRELVIEGIQWLLKTNYQHLASTVRSLLFVQGKNTSTSRCTIGDRDQVESCSYSTCSWSYSSKTKQGEGNCEDAEFRKLPTLELTSEMTFFEKHRKENDEQMRPIRAVFKHLSSMKFWCQLSNCNNQQNGRLVKEAINRLQSTGNQTYQTNIFFLIET